MSDTQQYEHDLFISFADADRAWVEGYLMDALLAADVGCHSEEAFALGVPRLLEFERAVQNSKRTLLILSPAYLTEHMSRFTDLLAQSYGLESATWPVIPLILSPVDLPPRLAMLTALDATDMDGWESIVGRLCAELQRPVPTSLPRPPCPYPGMAPFGEAESDRFYGRDDEIADLVQRLRSHPFVSVIGPSGSGKSSLVFAGLLPALRSSGLFGPGEWLVRTMRPGPDPLSALAFLLQGDLGDLEQTVADLLSAQEKAEKLLVVIDQFEEAFTLGQTPDRFFEAIARLTDLSNCYTVITVRADFYADLMTCALWPCIQAHRLEVPPMGEANLRQAIVSPAEDAGVFVEAALVERLIADAGTEPGILPLVQETLVLLWEHVERRFMPLSAYDALVLPRSTYGSAEQTGLQVAMARHADTTLAELIAEEQVVARRIILRLVQFGEGRSDTRRQQAVTALYSIGDDPEQFNRVLHHLAGRRLLTMTGTQRESTRRVDLAHEALLSGWPLLREWLDERRESEQVRRRLQVKAAEWDRLGRDAGGRLDPVELLEAERWIESADAKDLGYGEDILALVESSRAAAEEAERQRLAIQRRELEQAKALAQEQRQRAQEQRQRAQEQQQRADEQALAAKRLRRLLVGLVTVSVIAVSAAIAALTQRSSALQARETAEANRVTAEVASTRAVSERNIASTAQADAEVQRDEAERQRQFAVDQQATAIAERNIAATAQVIAQTERDAADQQRQEAERQQMIALSRQLAAQALSLTADRPALALLLSLESSRIDDSPETRGSVLTGLLRNPHLAAFLHSQNGDVRTVAVSPDAQTLAMGTEDGSIVFWDREQLKPLSPPIEAHESRVNRVAFSPDGSLLASAGGKSIALWDTSDYRLVTLFLGHEGSVTSVAFSPDGKTLASGGTDLQVLLWDVGTQSRLENPLIGHSDWIFDVAFSPDATTLASSGCAQWENGCKQGEILVWDIETHQQRGDALLEHTDWVVSLAYSPDGKFLASGSWDNTVILWDLATLQPLTDPLQGHSRQVNSIAISPDGGLLASASWDNTIVVWDLATYQPLGDPLSGHTDRVNSIVFVPDGHTLLSGGYDDKLILWDTSGSQSVGLPLTTYDSPLTSVAYSPDGQMLALGSEVGTIALWDLTSGTEHTTPWIAHLDGWVNRLAFSPDGRLLASGGDDDQVVLWNASTGNQVGKLVGHTDDVIGLAFAPDGQTLASSSNDGDIILWDVTGQQPIAFLRAHEDRVNDLAFSPDGQLLASASWDNTILLWDVASGQTTAPPLTEHADWVTSVSFSPQGNLLASASADGTILIWDLVSLTPRQPPLTGHGNRVRSVAFSPDGLLLASAGEDNAVILWDVTTGQQIGAALDGHDDKVWEIAFSPDGDTLASISNDASCILWDVSLPSWQIRACRKANRNLSPDEWEQFIGDSLPYESICAGLVD